MVKLSCFISPLSQLNYEGLARCVASGPITPMEEKTWDHMLQLLRPSLKEGVTMREILAELHGEVTSGYEDTLRKLVGKQMHSSSLCVD